MKISHVIESVDSKVAPVSAPLRTQSTRTQLKQHVYSAPEKKTPAVVNHIKSKDVKEGMAQDEAEETNGWRAELVNQINYNTFEVKMTNTRSKESANFIVRPVDMISIGPTLQIETMDVHDLQTGQTASWTSDDPQPGGGIVYAIAMMFWDNKELQKKLWTIVDQSKDQDLMPGLNQRRSIGQEVDADAYIDSQEKTQAAMAKMKKGLAERLLAEFYPDDNEPNEPNEHEILRKLAAQWWHGTEQEMIGAQKTLAVMGWEIGQVESGDEDAGVFVIAAGDIHGDTYTAFGHTELEQVYRGLHEDAAGVGVVASKKQKNDPRYKTSLTVDVHPDTPKKNMRALRLI
jgi:hypothetical protein